MFFSVRSFSLQMSYRDSFSFCVHHCLSPSFPRAISIPLSCLFLVFLRFLAFFFRFCRFLDLPLAISFLVRSTSYDNQLFSSALLPTLSRYATGISKYSRGRWQCNADGTWCIPFTNRIPSFLPPRSACR